MASFESMSDVELRKILVEYGFDIPVAGNRDFIIKKLNKLQDGPVAAANKGKSSGRKSTSSGSGSVVVRPTPPPPPPQQTPVNNRELPPANVNNGRGATPRPNSRLSLNDSGKVLGFESSLIL